MVGIVETVAIALRDIAKMGAVKMAAAKTVIARQGAVALVDNAGLQHLEELHPEPHKNLANLLAMEHGRLSMLLQKIESENLFANYRTAKLR
jgi:hypothetical protein